MYTVQKLLVEYPSTEDNDDGNGSESSATSLIYDEDVCHPRTDQSLIIPEISQLNKMLEHNAVLPRKPLPMLKHKRMTAI